ncbi:MAG: SurA N-terminal domain-containing protein [Candidatus Omnitrophica bacterium]|nr:SurA N-terminal domain-containing protein [Candidatus Omnitrophota bacterium]
MNKSYSNGIACLIAVTLILTLNPENVSAQSAQIEDSQVAGEFFGVPVSAGNYYFAKRVVMTFGAKWRGAPKDEAELEDLVWQELLFSYEAFNRGITVSEQEIDEEIEKILKADKVDFSFRVDKEKYQQWVKDKLGMSIEAFRNQMEHLVKLEKLRTQIIAGFEPEVSEEDAYAKFLNEYNTLMVELKEFADIEAAQEFYKKAVAVIQENANEELIWNDLIYSYEASLRKFKALDEDVDKAIESLLRNAEVNFKWKEETDKYNQWINDKFEMNPDDFRKQVTGLATADAFTRKILAKEQAEIENKAKYSEFLKKNKTIAIAYNFFFDAFESAGPDVLKFDSASQAKKFYSIAGRLPGFWEDEKRKDPGGFKVPGFVALDFLIHMWGFNKEDAYKMLDEQVGAYYPPAPIYKGYGVFKIKKIRKADPGEFESKKDDYLKKVKMIKQYDMYKQWVDDYKKKAAIKVYIK